MPKSKLVAPKRTVAPRVWGWSNRFGFFALGAGIGLSQAPFSQPFLLFLLLPFLAYLVALSETAKQGWVRMWWTGLGFFTLVMNWIIEPFLVDIKTFGWMAPFALIFMAAGLALFWGAAGWAAVKLTRDYTPRVVLLAVTWAGFEFARATILTGFPWALMSYAWIDTPIAQLASVLGPHGMGLALLLAMFAPAMLFPRAWAGGLWVLVLFLAAGIWGELRKEAPLDLHPRGTIVRLVQPNAAQHLKWRRDMMPLFFQRQLGYTAARATRAPDVVIWPETSMPFFLGNDPERLQMIADAAGPSTDVIGGVMRNGESAGYNSMVHLDQRGGVLTVFDKHHLVPFGEYIPFEKALSQFGLRGLANLVGGFASGEGPRVINSLNLPPYLPLICYEVIFPSYARTRTIRPDWMVHITNDAWFGSFSGPYQHLVQARMRAIEQGLPVARAANTGISAMIDPVGQIVDHLPLNSADYLDVALPAPLAPTIYSRLGDLPYFAVSILLALLCLLRVTQPSNKED